MTLFQTLSKTVRITLWGIALCVPAAVIAESLEDRLKPVGEVCMAGDPCAADAPAAASASGPRSGTAIYSTSCATCHNTGAAGAPTLEDSDAWETRLAERGKDGLYSSAINGFKGMPAKGLCMDCTEEELHAAVDFMLAESN